MRSMSESEYHPSRFATVTKSSGQTYTCQTSYTKGQGVTHTGTCTDSQGNTISCH